MLFQQEEIAQHQQAQHDAVPAKGFEIVFADENAYGQYVSRAVSQSYWPAPFGIERGYATLTLVTCSTYTHDDNPRVLVHGRLVPVT